MRMMFVVVCLLFLVHQTYGRSYCEPDMSCYPNKTLIDVFDETLDGKVFSILDPVYHLIAPMKNTRVTKYPKYIVVVKSTSDVQKAVLFSKEKNLRVVVQSSGHDFQGRSTANNAFMIYLGDMKEIEVKASKTDRDPAGEIILESGSKWVDVYKEVDKHSRVVVGGSAHTVAIGGYTLGGGHSPISGMVGLGVDSLLEVEMVAADGSLVIADDISTKITYPNGTTETSSDTDIFWALRGGGGGTYGIVTKFTFKMHNPPSSMVKFVCDYPIIHPNGTIVGKNILRKYADLVPSMPAEWGGYLIMSSTHTDLTKSYYSDGSVGSLSLFLNHFGGYNTATRQYMDQMMNYAGIARYCFYQNVSTFWEYEQNVTDVLYMRNVILGTLMQANSFTDEWVDFIIEFVLQAYRNNWYATSSLTGILLGGKVNEIGVNATSVHPGWRTAVMSTAIGIGWGNDSGDKYDQEILNFINTYQDRLYAFGNGMYPNEAGSNVPSWQTHFWGVHYEKLKAIKAKWDPDEYFLCLECVGGFSSAAISVRCSILVSVFVGFATKLLQD